jgi:hypothetical protein
MPVFGSMVNEILASFLFRPQHCEVIRPLFFPTPPMGILTHR